MAMQRRQEDDGMITKVVSINRVSKTVKGGRVMKFAALIVVGDGKGNIGYGVGKSGEVPEAIRKGEGAAKKNMHKVALKGTTIPHEIVGKYGAGAVLLKPAAPGTGMIAGGIGMGLFDLLSGWTLWAPFTLVIVGCMGFVVGAITEKRKSMGFIVLALIAACAIKIVGYYFAEVVIYGNWVVPFTSIPGNLIQIGVAAVITLIIIKPLQAAAEHTILKKA